MYNTSSGLRPNQSLQLTAVNIGVSYFPLVLSAAAELYRSAAEAH
jgi:multisubunit Na+/H+ antiporter MnhC subunit